MGGGRGDSGPLYLRPPEVRVIWTHINVAPKPCSVKPQGTPSQASVGAVQQPHQQVSDFPLTWAQGLGTPKL